MARSANVVVGRSAVGTATLVNLGRMGEGGAMSDHEWYRSPDWDASEQARFATKLARARPHNRPQYLRIKALALLDTGAAVSEKAGVQLLHQVLETGDSFEAAAAHERLGEHHLARSSKTFFSSPKKFSL